MKFQLLVLSLMTSLIGLSQTNDSDKGIWSSKTFEGLKWRSIGPAIASGRITDFAVNSERSSEYYVATASGGVWKTVNSGTTYQPIFDKQGSYSIGCITIDPNNPFVIWVGTGENNSQRSVGYGDGVYRSRDGGKNWENMGLKNSQHIGKIVVDPRNSNIVYVASQGPLWKAGGDRGLYKTTDGGKTWKAVLTISQHTGVSDLVYDPRDPDVLYVSAYQRRRHVWTLINGGPESAIYKSEDAGASWRKIEKGLPEVDMGRIGLAISPVNPDILYAIIETSGKEGGIFRSSDRGETWEKRNDMISTSPQYYQELVCDPRNEYRVYSLDTWTQVTNDGGKTWSRLGNKNRHVDDHALWIDPNDTDHYIIGGDGGIYESWDRAQTWDFKSNLPVTQYYKVAVDDDEPFYNVYGGTQDNFSMGGPSRTTNIAGIVNSDWYITLGGDGFESQIEPGNPDIVYSQYQYGNLFRFDKKSGERINIKPQEGRGQPGLRWNWDAAFSISPHSPTRLYFGANILFRSEDRGNSWIAISGDLSRQIDRNKLPVMGRVWSVDAVAKNNSTSIYGNIVVLAESPLQEDLIYVGTDDGLIQITENGGQSWTRIEKFPGVPDRTYINAIWASQHNANVVYAAFNNHKNGDFKPYILRSSNKGRNWAPINGDLPQRGSVYSLAEDHVDFNLLFAGTEFGLFFSQNGGQKWIQLKNGIPTIPIRDIAIQKRENDLVLASFGRSFYILDDYSSLRNLSSSTLTKEAHIFPVKDSWMFVPSRPLGMREKTHQGESYYTAENPPLGAVFTYYLKDKLKTGKAVRQEKEKTIKEKGGNQSYPSIDQLRVEDDEEKPYLLFTIMDGSGETIRMLKTEGKKGFHRIVWDFRYPANTPIQLKQSGPSNPFKEPPSGHLAIPGTYKISLSKVVNNQITELVAPLEFRIKTLNNSTLPAEDKEALAKFEKQVSGLRRSIHGAEAARKEMVNRIDHIQEAIRNTPEIPMEAMTEARNLKQDLKSLNRDINGDRTLSTRNFEIPPSLKSRVDRIIGGLWRSTSAPTATQREQYELAGEMLGEVLVKLTQLDTRFNTLEQQLESLGAPWTPGRIPSWSEN